MEYVLCLRIVMFYCDLVQLDFTLILQGNFNCCRGNLMIAPVPVKQPWKIWLNSLD